MTEADKISQAVYIRDNVDWSKYPKLAAIFQNRPLHNVYWLELVDLLWEWATTHLVD